MRIEDTTQQVVSNLDCGLVLAVQAQGVKYHAISR
jgi:hypothetical protein